MKVLFLSGRLPHESARGGYQIVYRRIRHLLQDGFDVGLATFGRTDELGLLDDLRSDLLEISVRPIPHRKSTLDRGRRYLFSSVPPPFWSMHDPAMYRIVGDMVERYRYDIVLAEFCEMGQYLYHNRWLPAVRKVISTHRVASLSARTPMVLEERTLLRSTGEHIRMRNARRYEFNLYRCADRVLVLSQMDRLTLQAHAPELSVSVIPAGMNTDYFQPPATRASEETILLTGQYQDEPNRDAFLWFTKHIWPLLRERHPDLKFTVVGPNATPEMQAMADHTSGIELAGDVEDLRPYLARAKIYVCPVRMGSGLHVKVLEAMASGIPVVATTLATEGIPVQSGVNCMLADHPTVMARAIDVLLQDTALRQGIAEKARTMVQHRFNWERSQDLLKNTLREVTSGA